MNTSYAFISLGFLKKLPETMVGKVALQNKEKHDEFCNIVSIGHNKTPKPS